MTLFCHLMSSWSLFYFVPRNLTAKLARLICASSHGDLLIYIASATSGELQSELQHNVSDPYRTCILVYFVWVPICLLVHCVVFNSSTRSLLWIKSHQRHVCITCVRALLQGTGGPRSPEVPCINVYPNSIPFKATVCINQPSALF